MNLDARSWLVRLMGRTWPGFVRWQRWKVVVGFACFFVTCLVGIGLSIKVDSDMPAVFPDSHNQVAGKQFKDMFDADIVDVASSAVLQDTWICDISTPRRKEDCKDNDLSCGTWSSLGYCQTKRSVMQQYCQKSCGLCDSCLARWCTVDEPPQHSLSASSDCSCLDESAAPDPAPEGNASAGDVLPAVLHFQAFVAGYSSASWPGVQRHFTEHFERIAEATSPGTLWTYRFEGSASAWQQPPLAQQHWRSGGLASWPAFETPTFRAQIRGGVGAAQAAGMRTFRHICFCRGIQPCNTLNGSAETITVQESGNSRRLDVPTTLDAGAARKPAPQLLPASPLQVAGRRLTPRQSTVTVIYGLQVRKLGPFELFVQTDVEQIWYFDDMFEPGDPWTQRSMLNMFESLPDALRVSEASRPTWLYAYEDWLQSRGTDFPSRRFHETTLDFVTADTQYSTVFLRGASGRVRAIKTDFLLQLTDSSALGPALEAMNAWSDYVAAQNEVASIRAGRAWHTSPLWVRVGAQHGIIQSTAAIILISVAAGFLAMVLFTGSCSLALLSMVSVMLIVVSLLFFMVTVMQWAVGAIEVVALIVFLGYMFTFNLHISHAYIHAPGPSRGDHNGRATLLNERFRRIRYALVSMGQSLIGSATTSVGCALFLIFCTLQFFVKFGLVILSVTVLSLVYALLFLPALLLVCGPVPGAGCCRCGADARLETAAADSVGSNVEPPCPLALLSDEFPPGEGALRLPGAAAGALAWHAEGGARDAAALDPACEEEEV